MKNSIDTSPRDVSAIEARYRAIGLFGGLFIGAMVGVMVAGPNFREWSGLRSLATILGAFGVGGVLGYIAGEIAISNLTAGPAPGVAADGEGEGGEGGGAGSGDS